MSPLHRLYHAALVGCALALSLTSCSDGRTDGSLPESVPTGIRLDVPFPSDGGSYTLFYDLSPAHPGDADTLSGSIPVTADDPVIQLDLAPAVAYYGTFWLQGSRDTGYVRDNRGTVSIDRSAEGRGPLWQADIRGLRADGAQATVALRSALCRVGVWTTAHDYDAALRLGFATDCTDICLLLDGQGGDGAERTDTLRSDTPAGTPRSHGGESYAVLFETDVLVTDNRLADAVLQLSGPDYFHTVGCYNLPLRRGEASVRTGRFLTADVVFNITISPSFDGEYNRPCGN